MTADRALIVDLYGQPMKYAASMGSSEPYRGASSISDELANYNPENLSPDASILENRDLLVARTRDLIRNNGFVNGAIQSGEDNVIGPRAPRLTATPDHKVIGISKEDARRIGREIETLWRTYTEDPDFYIDASMKQNFHGLSSTVYRMWASTGEILALPRWKPGRGSMFSTAVELVEPDHLSNPDDQADDDKIRGGVEIGSSYEANAYHLQSSHPGDVDFGQVEKTWTRFPRATPWGRRNVIHGFRMLRPRMTRGEPGTASIIESCKMLDIYERAEAQTNIINSLHAAVIQSPYDDAMVDKSDQPMDLMQQGLMRAKMHQTRNITFGGSKILQTYPGEEMKLLTNTRSNQNFSMFEASFLRRIAAGLGRSYEQVSRDYSKTNYSSARASLLEAWKYSRGELVFVTSYFYAQVYALWLEEVINRGLLSIPSGAKSFYQAKSAWCSSRWGGPGRGWIDPVKEAQAAAMRIASGLSTLEDECAEQGKDYEVVIAQLAIEQQMLKDAGLPPLNLEKMLGWMMSVEAPSDKENSNE